MYICFNLSRNMKTEMRKKKGSHKKYRVYVIWRAPYANRPPPHGWAPLGESPNAPKAAPSIKKPRGQGRRRSTIGHFFHPSSAVEGGWNCGNLRTTRRKSGGQAPKTRATRSLSSALFIRAPGVEPTTPPPPPPPPPST